MSRFLLLCVLLGCSSTNSSGGVDAQPVAGGVEGAVVYQEAVATRFEEFAIECEAPTEFTFLRAAGDRWTKTGDYGLSTDDGHTWTSFAIDTHIFTYGAPLLLGHVLVAMREPVINNIDALFFSVDDGLTWEQPVFNESVPELSFGTTAALLSDNSKVAIAPTGRIWLDDAGEWISPDDSYPPLQVFGSRHASGGVETSVWDSPPTLAVSTDTGNSWARYFNIPIVTSDVFPSSDGTLIARWGTSEPDRGVAFSADDGKSWRAFSNLIPLLTIGPGPREVWTTQFVRITAGEEVIRLLHTEDAGESWAEVSFSLDGVVLSNLKYFSSTLRMERGFRDTNGKRVFGLLWDGESHVCREAS